MKEDSQTEFKQFVSSFSPQVTGIGIGVAGLIDRSSGRVLISPNLNIVEEINLIEEIRKKFAVPGK